jgi:hypothetical protein
VVSAATLSRIEVSQSSVLGGTTLQGFVTLASEAPPGGTFVTLSSNNDAVTLPATITVAPGTTRAEFVVSTRAVSSDQEVTLTGSAGGETRTAPLRVNAIGLSGLTLSRPEIGGGLRTALAVQLGTPAAQGGTTVTLNSSDSAVSVPANVTVPAGQTGVTADITTRAVPSAQSVTITARTGSQSRTAVLRVLPLFMSFVGQPNDFVTRGTSRRLEAPSHALLGNGEPTYMQIQANSPTGGDSWLTIFRPGRQRQLSPGKFVMTSVSDFDSPSVTFGGAGRGCTPAKADFEIFEIEFGPGEKLIKLHMIFSQLCSSNTPALQPSTGEIWFAGVP